MLSTTTLPTKKYCCYCVVVDATVRGIAERIVIYTVATEQNTLGILLTNTTA